jgi:hypothetical protein
MVTSSSAPSEEGDERLAHKSQTFDSQRACQPFFVAITRAGAESIRDGAEQMISL